MPIFRKDEDINGFEDTPPEVQYSWDIKDAGKGGDSKKVKEMLDAVEPREVALEFLKDGLSYAAMGNYPVLLKCLMEYPLNASEKEYRDDLLAAYYRSVATLENANPEILKLLLKGFKNNKNKLNDALGQIFDAVAARGSSNTVSAEAAKMLINAGANPNLPDSPAIDGYKKQKAKLDDQLNAVQEFKKNTASKLG